MRWSKGVRGDGIEGGKDRKRKDEEEREEEVG